MRSTSAPATVGAPAAAAGLNLFRYSALRRRARM